MTASVHRALSKHSDNNNKGDTMTKRIFWIVADSFGIGDAPDASLFGDAGANTLASCMNSEYLQLPTMRSLGLFHIDGVSDTITLNVPFGNYARVREASAGKDTTIGHWELCGLYSKEPLPTYPDGFPDDILAKLKVAFGREILCNRPYSGTKVIADYGEEHLKTGALIVYTSADSVLQIAAHEDLVPLQELYRCCEAARAVMQGEHGVGRVIARPFVGDTQSGFTRTAGRHDYSLTPPAPTVLDAIKSSGKEVIGIGKIHDIFAGQGITRTLRTTGNPDGIAKTISCIGKDFEGLCFVNLVDFDMVYGHRRDIDGYAKALTELDKALEKMLSLLQNDDVLLLTADHGCDPGYRGTDHTRECVPLLIYGKALRHGVNLGTRDTYADIGATVAELLGVTPPSFGTSFAKELIQ